MANKFKIVLGILLAIGFIYGVVFGTEILQGLSIGVLITTTSSILVNKYIIDHKEKILNDSKVYTFYNYLTEMKIHIDRAKEEKKLPKLKKRNLRNMPESRAEELYWLIQKIEESKNNIQYNQNKELKKIFLKINNYSKKNKWLFNLKDLENLRNSDIPQKNRKMIENFDEVYEDVENYLGIEK
ncbi:MAG: hypothetical protein FXF47_08500 [Candidatus Mcinerneyibacterium aminivorans]|uniref:Uncharacterized protein n=1 Tax=Candidatus Mcinerneyibacterium aminivorans TaxID=2703815 RepID=A0A5D0MFB3_9BACT|nr:MAG: hypothetical protein FXF47_08500 [Candidatus Mcinerneyibacterium aminivorans]